MQIFFYIKKAGLRAEGPRARGGEFGAAFALAWHKMKRPCDAMSSREGKGWCRAAEGSAAAAAANEHSRNAFIPLSFSCQRFYFIMTSAQVEVFILTPCIQSLMAHKQVEDDFTLDALSAFRYIRVT